MAKRKTELNQYVSLPEKDYLTLLEDHLTLRALKLARIEKGSYTKGSILL